MRITRFWLLSSVLFLVLAGCGQGNGDQAGDGNQRRFISIGTAPPGGAFFVVGGALTQTINEKSAELNWEATPESTSGTQENIRRLAKGEFNFALANSSITYFAVRGEGDWEQSYPMRSVMTLAPNVGMFLTPKGSGIETIADFKGKRIVVGPAGAGFEYFLRPILAAHGVTYDDFTQLHGSQAAAADMLADGSAAAAFLGGVVPTASITQATSSQDIHFIPLDPSARQQLIDDYAFFLPATVPAETYRGQDSDYESLVVGPMHLITSSDADEDLVYAFTKLLYENRATVVEKHPVGKAINPNNVVRDLGTPFHPGAIRFYREIGIWPDADTGETTE